MKKYEAYKDSGIEWIGEIPKEWSILRMKHYFYMKGRIGWQGLKADEFIEDGPYLVTGTDFVNGKVCWERCYHISEERFNEAPEIHVQQGDLLITKDGTVGKLALIEEKPEKVSLNSHLLILRPVKGEINNHFVYWALQSMIFKDYVGFASSGSTMASLSQEKIGEFPLILPTLSEQQIIVSYLDYKIGQIDASVSAINSQIDDLKAYRQSIISETVTKGLKSDVKMKDSGVEWIGEIPEEWEFRKIKTLLTRDSDNIKVGPFGSSLSGNDIEAEGNYWVYNQRTILDNNFTTNNSFVSDDKYQELKSFSVYPGDILITTRGTIGKVAIVPEGAKEGILHPCVIRFKVDESMVNKQYLKYIFNDCNIMSEQVKYGSNATTIEVIYSYTLKDLKMPVPSLSEQQAIATYLDIKTSKIDSAIKSLEAQRDDLNAFKQSIISEAVTGKIDVRDWKPSIE